MKELIVTHTQDSDHKPLCTIRNFPGMDADLTPAQLRDLADALYYAAEDCEDRPMAKAKFATKDKTYVLGGGRA